jgi:hypothetical protein
MPAHVRIRDEHRRGVQGQFMNQIDPNAPVGGSLALRDLKLLKGSMSATNMWRFGLFTSPLLAHTGGVELQCAWY